MQHHNQKTETDLPPQDLDAERALLSCMMQSQNAIQMVANQIRPSDFYSDAHIRTAKVIYDLAETMADRIDPAMVAIELHKRGELDQIGGVPYLGQIAETPANPLNADYFADRVREMANRRNRLDELRAESLRTADCTQPFAGDGRPRGATPVIRCMADVEPRGVDWLWPGRIPAGRISLLVGKPGEGKSFLTVDLTARVSTGTPWPDGSPCSRGSVVLISAEDDPADTIRPRLDAHHADASRVHLLSAVRRRTAEGSLRDTVFTLADVDALEKTLAGIPDCRLVVIDPIGSYLGGGTDAHRDNEVRGVLAPVAKLAERYGAAVLVVAHRRKGNGGSADDSALGSRAFTGIARAVWHLSRDRTDKARRLLLAGKINIAEEGTGMAFSIIPEPGRIVWEREPVHMTADDALASESESNEGLSEAEHWFLDYVANGPVLAKDGSRDAKDAGISEKQLRRAREKHGAAFKDLFDGGWKWRLKMTAPQDAPEGAQDALNSTQGALGAFGSSEGIFDDPTGGWK